MQNRFGCQTRGATFISMKAMQVNVSDDLDIAIGDRSTQLNPGDAFRLAERLIRTATTRMIVEETEASAGHTARKERAGR